MIITEQNAEHKFAQLRATGNDVYFNGWDIQSFRANDDAYYSKHGIFRNGQYGYVKTFKPQPDGRSWKVFGFKR